MIWSVGGRPVEEYDRLNQAFHEVEFPSICSLEKYYRRFKKVCHIGLPEKEDELLRMFRDRIQELRPDLNIEWDSI